MKLRTAKGRAVTVSTGVIKALLSAAFLSCLAASLLLPTLPPMPTDSDVTGDAAGKGGRPHLLTRGIIGPEAAEPGRSRHIRQHLLLNSEADYSRPSVVMETWCCASFTALAIDGVLLVNDTTPGLHVFIVNQATASLMGHHPVGSWEQAQSIVLSVAAGRLLILTRVPRALTEPFSRQIVQQLPRKATSWVFRSLGSREFDSLKPTDSWILTAFARVGRIDEKRLPGGNLLSLSATVKLTLKEDPICPLWPVGSSETIRRRQFCAHVDGFSNVCNCGDPSPIDFPRRPLAWFGNKSAVVPITVMSSNKPQFLFRTLTSLLRLSGLNDSQVGVLLRGYFEEPRLICQLLQVTHSQYKQLRDSSSNLYRLSMADTLLRFETTQFMILLEDGIDPSPDMIDFFNQTLPLLLTDKDLFCIGVWNDQSFTHTSSDPRLVDRTQYVPLKAVAFRRQLWEEELIAQWPEEPIDLAKWLSEVMGPRRYCLRPTLSRIFVYSESEQLIRQQYSPRHLSSAIGNNSLLIKSTAQYDQEIQQMLDRAVNLNARLKSNCASILQSAVDLSGNWTSSIADKPAPAFLISVNVPNRAGLRAFWQTVVARCFMLNPVVSCLYKGVCLIRFEKFLLLVNFKPFSQFSIPNVDLDITYPTLL